MSFVARWLTTLLAVLLVSFVLPFVKADVTSAAIFALVLGLLNAFVRPVVWLLTLPLTIITLGLFALVLNLIIFWLADELVEGIQVEGGPLGLIVAALAVSIVSGLIGRVVKA